MEASGAPILDPTLRGQALVQLSSGAMQATELAATFTNGARRSGKTTGRPGGLKVVSNSGLKPVKKIIHIQEK